MLDLIRRGLERVVLLFTRRGKVTDASTQGDLDNQIAGGTPTVMEPGSPMPRILAEDLSSPSATANEGDPVDLSRWSVTEHAESPFEKVGRLYVGGDTLVIRSEIDPRGFCVTLVDVEAVLDGETKSVRLFDGRNIVGTTRLSVSGRAVNFSIDPFFYTTPLRSVVRILAGEQRKAPLFVGRDQVE